jgi:hypothetical protein
MVWLFLISCAFGAYAMWVALWLMGCIRTRAEYEAAQGKGTSNPALCKNCGHAL